MVEEVTENMGFRWSVKLFHIYFGKYSTEIVHFGLKLKISILRNNENVFCGNLLRDSGTRAHGVANFSLLGHIQ